jgi:hypothetical protein
MTRVVGGLPAPPLALAGGSLIFAGFVVVLFVVLVFGYYTRRGSGISQTPYRRSDAPPESPSELAHDQIAEVRHWQRGTAGQHRRQPEATRDPVDPEVTDALRDWRRGSRQPPRLDPPVGVADHLYGQQAGTTVTGYLDLASEPCRFAWQLLTTVAAEQPIRVAVRHLPLADVHPLALPAAEALEAAGAQGQFFELLDRIATRGFRSQSELMDLATSVVGDPDRLRAEVDQGRHRETVIGHIRQATASGAHAVPELYIDAAQYDGVLARDALSRTLSRKAQPQ